MAGTTAIRIPIVKRGVVDFAVSADWTPAAGDVKIAVDNTAPTNVTNLPTATTSGNTAFWEFILTAAELSCKQAVITVADSATKAVEDTEFIVETFGNASAMWQADISLPNLPANVTQLLGTAWLTPGTAGTPDVNCKLWNGLTTVALPLVPTTAGRTLDVSATGEAGIDWANIGSPTTSVNLSGTTVATVTNQLTAAQIATGVWQDSTGTDFTTASSIGKALYTGNFAPGAAGGLLISGSNAGTTTLGALTITGVTTHTGNVLLSDGLTIAVPSTTDRSGITIAGNGAGSGITSTGGDTGSGAIFTGGVTSGSGLACFGGGNGSGLFCSGGTIGKGAYFYAPTDGHGLQVTGGGSGRGGIVTSGGSGGPGFRSTGGAGSSGIIATGGSDSHGFMCSGTGTGSGLYVKGGATGSGMSFVGGATSGNAITTSATSGTIYINSNVTHIKDTASAGAAGYMGPDWGNVTAQSTSVNLSGTTIATVTNQLTQAQIATGVWTDSTGSDFTTASSIGKALYTGNVVPGGAGGLFIAGTNAATTITTALTTTFTGSLTGSVGSVATGGITSASFAADAISSAAVSAAAVAKIWAQAMTELSAVPGVTSDALSALSFVFEMTRNKIEQNSTTQTVYKDDGSTTLATSTITDSAGTYTRNKFS